jgi:hypothetical protein
MLPATFDECLHELLDQMLPTTMAPQIRLNRQIIRLVQQAIGQGTFALFKPHHQHGFNSW